MSIFQPLDTATVCGLTVGPLVSLSTSCNAITSTINRGGTSQQMKQGRGRVPKNEPGQGVWNMLAKLVLNWDSIALQEQWAEYQAAIHAQWEVCADPTGFIMAKQLFLQYNMLRQLMGQAPLIEPTDKAAYSAGEVLVVRVDLDGSGGVNEVVYFNSDTANAIFVVGQLKRGLRNPNIIIPPGPEYVATVGDPLFDQGIAFVEECIPIDPLGSGGVDVICCQSHVSGAPGNKVIVGADFVQNP